MGGGIGVERNFQVAIQACLDIANYIIARKRFSVPEAEGNAFAILGQEGVIPVELADKIRGMIGFRNVLVHDYLPSTWPVSTTCSRITWGIFTLTVRP